jgi:hypothetical protein
MGIRLQVGSQGRHLSAMIAPSLSRPILDFGAKS